MTCANFGESCGKRDVCIITNDWVGDILHPVTVTGNLVRTGWDNDNDLRFDNWYWQQTMEDFMYKKNAGH